jgi:RNA polymerase sigma-70 factor (ECF subfamily)
MRTAQGAEQADLRTLYSEHHGWLFGWLQWRMGNAADAADLAQDTFLRLILKPAPGDLRGPGETRAYLRTIAQGMCIDLWRRRQVEQAWLDTLAAQPQAIIPSEEHTAIVIETLMEIGELISRLGDKVQRAFVMAQIHGMRTTEISKELGVSVRMVQKYLSQAMLSLILVDAGLHP